MKLDEPISSSSTDQLVDNMAQTDSSAFHFVAHGENRDAKRKQSPFQRWDKMDPIFQMIFSNAFSSVKKFEFPLIFHRSLFPSVELTISQYWFR